MDPKQEERATLLLESEALDQALARQDVLTLETLTLPQTDASMTEELSMMRMMAMSWLVVFWSQLHWPQPLYNGTNGSTTTEARRMTLMTTINVERP